MSALVCLAELVTSLEGEGGGLAAHLDTLYTTYGLHTRWHNHRHRYNQTTGQPDNH